MYKVTITYYDSNGKRPTSVEGTYATLEQAQAAADRYNMGADYSHATVGEVSHA